MIALEEWVKILTLSLGSMVEGAASIIICVAIIWALISYTRGAFGSTSGADKMSIRLALGKSLAVALEFLLAADILRTAVAPTWNDIGKLAAIATLRTLLNYFLERELKHSETRS